MASAAPPRTSATARRTARAEVRTVRPLAWPLPAPTLEWHRAGSIVITSNRGPDEWHATFSDPVRAQAAIDRFTSAACDLVVDGESYRRRQKPKLTSGHARQEVKRERREVASREEEERRWGMLVRRRGGTLVRADALPRAHHPRRLWRPLPKRTARRLRRLRADGSAEHHVAGSSLPPVRRA